MAVAMAPVEVCKLFRDFFLQEAEPDVVAEVVRNRQGFRVDDLELRLGVVRAVAFEVVQQQTAQVQLFSRFVHFEISSYFKGNLIFPGISRRIFDPHLKRF